MYFDPNASPLAGQCGYDQAECDAVRAENERLRADIERLDAEPFREVVDALDALRTQVERVRAYIDANEHPDEWGVPCVYTKDLRAVLDTGSTT